MRKKLGEPDENRKRAERLTDGTVHRAGAFTAAGRSLPGAIERDVEDDGDSIRRPGASAAAGRRPPREYAMSLVARSAYTERGLREKMRIRGYGRDETDDAVDYLKGFGYINDIRLAQNAAEKLAAKLNGRRKIFAYLASKGISRETVEALDLSEIDFRENCARAAEKMRALGKTKEQIMRSLSNAGFSASEITYAIGEID
ncbi:MAG: RecX family transcriptional regulator [Clostridia bacterium]|nr:RecX family transcriptional regulator [Clostridia bacterium]